MIEIILVGGPLAKERLGIKANSLEQLPLEIVVAVLASEFIDKVIYANVYLTPYYLHKETIYYKKDD